MRNFKKFLALVLAMLMVSACAVSVAAFDDVAATDDYAEAVELLANLGVIKGRNDGTNNFYPNETLTREEAAVIAAKILAGAKAVEWSAATTRFADVVDAWSFAFINYVDTENVMVGNANGEFNPKGTLQIDEAIKIALAIADTKAAFNAYVEMSKNPTMAWWTFYVQEANEIGLTDGIDAIRNYQAKCTRGMFAQLIYNAFELVDEKNEAVNDLKANFGYGDVEEVYIVLENDGAVVNLQEVVDGKTVDNKFTAALVNEALKAAGYTETVADLKAANSKISMSWFMVDNATKIASIDVLTTSKVVIYSDAEVKLANAYADINGDGKVEIKDHDIDKKYIVINDVKYEVAAKDGVSPNPIMGGADIVTVGIEVKLNNDIVAAGQLGKLPEFFKAFLYDDDGDGDYERCYITEYAIATVSKAAPEKADEVDQYTVTYQNAASGTVVNKDKKTAAKFSGLEVVADGETPMLIQVGVAADCTVDVIEVAAQKSGEVTGLTKSSIKIGGETVAFNAKFVEPDSKYLEQTATIFTIADKYVKVAKVSSSELTLMVESVKINADGNAVVTGYDVDNGFAKKDITVIGVSKNGKLNPVGAFRVAEEGATAEDVYLAAKKLAEADYEAAKYEIIFEDGHYYTFVDASKGIYVKIEDSYKSVAEVVNGVIENASPDEDDTVNTLYKFAVTDKYVKFATKSNGTAVAKYNVNAPAVITAIPTVVAEDDYLKDSYDAVKYSITTTIELAEVKAAIQLKDEKVKVVYINQNDIEGTNVIVNPLTASKTIVQVIEGAHEYGYSANIYKAVDLINNKVVNVTGNATVGSYYVADTADYKLIDDAAIDVANTNNQWVFDTDKSEIEVVKQGILYSIIGKYTQLEKSVKDDDNSYAPVAKLDANGNKKEYGVDQIKIYVGDGANNVIALNDDGTPKTLAVADFAKRFDIVEDENNGKFYVAKDVTYTYTKNVDYGVDTHTVKFEAVDTYVVGDTMIIVIDEKDTVTSKKYDKLPEGSIVKVLENVTEKDAKVNAYEVFDLFAEKIVTVTSEKELTDGKFYVAKDGVVADATATKWIRTGKAVSVADEDGKYVANAVYFVDDATTPRTYADTEYTAEQISVFEIVDGEVTELDAADVIGEDTKFTAYCVKGQIIIVK